MEKRSWPLGARGKPFGTWKPRSATIARSMRNGTIGRPRPSRRSEVCPRPLLRGDSDKAAAPCRFRPVTSPLKGEGRGEGRGRLAAYGENQTVYLRTVPTGRIAKLPT